MNDFRKINYPPARRSAQVDEYHGESIADPYRWLEDSDAPASRDWIDAQNRLTAAFLSEIPAREGLRNRLTRLWNYERFGIPFKQGNRYFFTRNDGLQNQGVLYTAAALTDTPRLLLDPNVLSPDGTTALIGTAVSRDGTLLAYGLAAQGSDWTEWRVRDVSTGMDLPDVVNRVKFSEAAWAADGSGFFYSRYDPPAEGPKLEELNFNQKLFYHRLGTSQEQDVLIYERPDQKEWGFNASVTDDGGYLVIHVWEGTDRRNRLYYRDLRIAEAPVVPLIDRLEAAFHFIDNQGTVFWLRTDLDAPRGRIIEIDLARPEPGLWKELVPQADETLESASVVGDRFLTCYLKDARTVVRVFKLDGRFEREVELPGIGTASGFEGKRGDPETFYAFTSFTVPATLYRYEVDSGSSTVFRRPAVDFSPGDYVTRQLFYPSKDGTRIPLYLTHKRDLVLDGSNPTYLYGYGGFSISLTPAFSVIHLAWLELGGVYAQANLRGGNEYGEDWHQGGMKAHKQNVFDDFIAAAEWLVAHRYTSPPKLAIAGASNGGLLVGACLTQRPELFGAALPAVGVLDMLRFHRFTIGWAWTPEYGSPDNPDEFGVLRAYSPLHNIHEGARYPATLITTADHDDRVVPGHSFKFAAALQRAQAGSAPVLMRIETQAGHGAGKPTSKLIEEAADVLAFLVRVLGIEPPPGRCEVPITA